MYIPKLGESDVIFTAVLTDQKLKICIFKADEPQNGKWCDYHITITLNSTDIQSLLQNLFHIIRKV
jgi:hypothetical protein